MLTVPELKALAVGMDLKLGSRNGSNRQAMLAWYSRTLLSPTPGSAVSSSKRVSFFAMLQPSVEGASWLQRMSTTGLFELEGLVRGVA